MKNIEITNDHIMLYDKEGFAFGIPISRICKEYYGTDSKTISNAVNFLVNNDKEFEKKLYELAGHALNTLYDQIEGNV